MTLIEAIKTGKRFRRKGSTEYYELGLLPNTFFVVDEVMADDWEVEPTAVSVTREQFNSAWDKAFSVDASTVERHIIMCRELGL